MNKVMINSAAKWGLLLGVVMSVSKIFEINIQVSGDMTDFALYSLEWALAVVFYIYMIIRANKMYRATRPEGEAYKFRDVMNYSILISIFASILVGLSAHTYIVNSIGGYEPYTELSMEAVDRVVTQADVTNESRDLFLSQSDNIIQSVADNPPTIFSALFSMVTNYILFGFIASIVAVWFVRRKETIKNDVQDEQ